MQRTVFLAMHTESSGKASLPSPAIIPQNLPHSSDSKSRSQRQSSTSRGKRNLQCHSRKPCSQWKGGQFGPSQPAFALPGIPTWQYPLRQMHSLGTKSKTDVLIHTSPSHAPTGGSAKHQAFKQGQTLEVHADYRCRAQNIGQLPHSTFAMTPPMSTVLGYHPTAQTSHDSRCELERGACELKEDEATFQPTEQGDNGTPVPFLVNLQNDMLLTYMRQTVKCAIDFAHDTNLWQDDATSPSRQRQTGAMRRKREFQFADGRCTAAASESTSAQGSLPGPAEEINEATIARL